VKTAQLMKTTAATKYIALADASSVGWIRTWIAKESPVAILIRNRKIYSTTAFLSGMFVRYAYVFYMNSWTNTASIYNHPFSRNFYSRTRENKETHPQKCILKQKDV